MVENRLLAVENAGSSVESPGRSALLINTADPSLLIRQS
jgi:hypothetical protein